MLERCVRLKPDDPVIQLQYARVLYRRGEVAQALRHAEIALKLAPNDPGAQAAVAELRAQPATTRTSGP